MIAPEKLNDGYELFRTMDGYCLCRSDGWYEWFVTYSALEKYAKENGIEL